MADIKDVLNKLDQIDSRLDDMNETLIVNTADLKYHIKRTDMLEKAVQPAIKTAAFINISIKLIVSIGGVIGFLVGIYAAVK